VKALGDEGLTRRILDDYTSAPDPRLRAALGFIRKLSLTPASVTSEDVRAVLAAGASRQAVADAVYVCFLFSTYTRLADTLGWEVSSAEAFDAGARHLLTRGYSL
jgi:alkylhydroperoxidase family enzyme